MPDLRGWSLDTPSKSIMRPLHVPLIVAPLLFSSIARAAPIEYLQDDRSHFYQWYLGSPVNDYYIYDATPPVPFEDWQGGGPDGAIIRSHIGPDQMNGWVEGSIWSDLPYYPPPTFQYSH